MPRIWHPLIGARTQSKAHTSPLDIVISPSSICTPRTHWTVCHIFYFRASLSSVIKSHTGFGLAPQSLHLHPSPLFCGPLPRTIISLSEINGRTRGKGLRGRGITLWQRWSASQNSGHKRFDPLKKHGLFTEPGEPKQAPVQNFKNGVQTSLIIALSSLEAPSPPHNKWLLHHRHCASYLPLHLSTCRHVYQSQIPVTMMSRCQLESSRNQWQRARATHYCGGEQIEEDVQGHVSHFVPNPTSVFPRLSMRSWNPSR